MTLQELGSLGEAIGGIAVIVSLVYLAIQIRQNTAALRSTSYHQAAEQTWNTLLVLARDEELASLIMRDVRELPPAEARLAALDASLLFGFENMLRLNEQGMVDPDVWENVIENSLPYLQSARVTGLLRARPGPLSRRLLEEVQRRPAASVPGNAS